MEAMLSKSAPVFYGDLRSHERVIFFVYIFKTLWNFELFSLMEVNKPNYSFCRFHYHFLPSLVIVSNECKTEILVMQSMQKMLLNKSIYHRFQLHGLLYNS